jgi:ParB-like chromosome segregation protein Spo0J
LRLPWRGRRQGQKAADPEGNIIAGHGRLQAARAMGLERMALVVFRVG